MIKGRRGSVDLSEDRPFQVKYMGSTLTTEPGISGIEKSVQRIYDKVQLEEKVCPKIILEVTKEGLTFLEGKRSHDGRLFPIKDISYCTLYRFETNIFAFNHHISKSPLKVECHAVMCSSEEKAKAISLALYSSFREGHFDELRKERKNVSSRRNSKSEQRRGSTESSSRESERSSRNGSSIWSYTDGNYLTADLGRDERELDNIVHDMLQTVEREKASLEGERKASLEGTEN